MYIIPQPKSIRKSVETYCIKYDSEIIIDNRLEPSLRMECFEAGKILNEEIAEKTGFRLSVKIGCPDERKNIIFFTCADYLDGEKYAIDMDSKVITLQAGSGAGFLYAVRTMQQIIRQTKASIPCMNIEDEPAISHRGFSLDTTRGRIPTLAELKRTADVCSFYKLNQLQLYIEHSYMFENESEMWRDSTPLTAEEILEFDQYCKKPHIELVPSLASFGHLYDLLRTKSYGHLCELEPRKEYSLVERMGHHTIDVSNPESFKVVTERIAEFLGLFTSKYFNICADETFDLCKGKSKALGEEKGVRRVYLDFLKKLCDYLISNGKIPMFWGDVVISEPGLVHELPKESILLNWEYAPEVKDENIKKLSEAGIGNVYLCPGVQSWNHMINRHHDAYLNISGMCANAHKYNVLGVLNTEWGDLGHIAHPEFSTIGQIYGAAFSWSDIIMSEEDINTAISVIQYGDDTGNVVSLMSKLADTECVNWWYAVQYKEEHDGSIDINKDDYKCLDNIVYSQDAMPAMKKIAENEDLLELITEHIGNIQPKSREDIAAYIIMGQGQLIFSKIGMYIYAKNLEKDTEVSLAEELERWFEVFSRLWRKVSKESELYRLRDIVNWYVDLLRGER